MAILFACPLYVQQNNKIYYLRSKEELTKKCIEEICNALIKEKSKNHIKKKINKLKKESFTHN